MNEPLVEGIGCVVGLGLLYYTQVWRPNRDEARARAARTAAPEKNGDTDRPVGE